MSAYQGPERRNAPDETLRTIEELRESVDALTAQVGPLTAQLEDVVDVRTAQQALDGEARRVFKEANEALAQERRERKQDRRHGRTIGACLLVLIVGLAVLAWRQYTFASSTRSDLNNLKGHSFSSCQTRNLQLAEVNLLVGSLVDIEDAIVPPPGGPAKQAALHILLKKLPGPVDCSKVYGS